MSVGQWVTYTLILYISATYSSSQPSGALYRYRHCGKDAVFQVTRQMPGFTKSGSLIASTFRIVSILTEIAQNAFLLYYPSSVPEETINMAEIPSFAPDMTGIYDFRTLPRLFSQELFGKLEKNNFIEFIF